MKKWSFLLLTALVMTTPATAATDQHQVAIVIDDFGNNMKGTEQMLSLPIPLTAAVMPFLPSSKSDAEAAHAKGYEVIIHMPMEPIKGKKSWLGPNAITTDLSDEEIRKRVEMAIAEVPHAAGMNNHMGSKVTADERVMRIILSVCREYGLFYLDSKTNPKSVVKKIAKELHVPIVENDLFFDDVYTSEHITRQADLLIERVQKEPVTVIIGHVGPPGEITSSVIRANIARLKQQAEPVFVSQLTEHRPILPFPH